MPSSKRCYAKSRSALPNEFQDQYADSECAKFYNKVLGENNSRTQDYKEFLVSHLRKNGCVTVLDAACGTGVDSKMLIEEGFKLVSVDASYQMLKYALKARWERRHDSRYGAWVIEEANWLTLYDDIQSFCPGEQFDAVLCLGNSFPHILDYNGKQQCQKLALENFVKCLKPGGLLMIDHRNFDTIVTGLSPAPSIYYYHQYPLDIKASVLIVRGRPEMVAFDYCIDAASDGGTQEKSNHRLCFYPHKLKNFTEMLDAAFGGRAEHSIYADFKPLEEVPQPAYYMHALKKYY